MNSPVQTLVDAFDRLADEDRREVLSAILRRPRDLPYPPLDAESIDRTADESFLEYDRREAEDAGR